MNKKFVISMAVLAVLCALPFAGAYPVFVMKILCYALFACAFNLLLGYAGLLSFGHAAFLGGAGYATGHALVMWGMSTIQGIAFGVAVATMMGVVFGALAIRRTGIYFAMITLALAQMAYFFFMQAPFTGGEDGLQAIPRGSVLGVDLNNDIALYYFVLAVSVLGFALCSRIVNSPFGYALKAIKDNEPRAISLGYDVERYKLIVFVLSAALAGLAGSLKALVFVSVTLADVVWHMSGLVVLMTLIGGVGTLLGPVIGALIVVVLENKVGEFGQMLSGATGWSGFELLGQSVPMVIGLIFILCVRLFRQGIVGELAHWLRADKPT